MPARHTPAAAAAAPGAAAAPWRQHTAFKRGFGRAVSRRSIGRRMPTTASANASEDVPRPDQPLAATNPPLEVERQSERALAYAAIAGLLGASGVALAVAPSRAVQFLWGACPSLLVAGLARTLGSTLLLAAVCANCLKEASEKDLLRSDTYKRLNLGLMWWGVATAGALWLAPAPPLRYALGAWTALLAATSAHAALTYQETSEKGEGLNPIFLVHQFLSSLGNLTSYANGPDTALYALYAYGLAAKAAVAAMVAILIHGQLKLAQDGVLMAPLGTLGESLLPALGGGYVLAAVVLFTLKDAASRGRLGASTFKDLNIGVSIVTITHVITFASWLQAGILAQSKLVYAKVGAHALIAAFAMYNYAFAKKKKGH
ncbi:hypothetical protein ABPG75_000846 [Micractinium tetrahymenae]